MKSKTIGIVFLVWFFASLVGMLFVGETESPAKWLMILFGQYFVVFGSIAVYANKGAKRFPSIVLMLLLVGLVCVGSGIYMLVGGEDATAKMFDFAPVLIMAVFPVAGILMIHMSVSEMLYLKRNCTYEVDAKCVDVSTSHRKTNQGRRRTIYMPTYSVWMDGKEYRIWNNKYTSKQYVVGEYYKLKVNPADVNEFVDVNSKSVHGGMLVVGIIFIVITAVIGVVVYRMGGV